MYITAQGARLRNDLYCVEWDVKLYYHTLPFLTSSFITVQNMVPVSHVVCARRRSGRSLKLWEKLDPRSPLTWEGLTPINTLLPTSVPE